MSMITLSTLTSDEIARVAAGRNDTLLQFADDVVALDAAGMLADALTPAPKPAAKVRKPKAAKTVDPTVGTGAAMAANWDGTMMRSAAGTITKGQRRNLARFGLTVGVERLSMVDASNIYHSLKLAA
jgi:hypothetical protein